MQDVLGYCRVLLVGKTHFSSNCLKPFENGNHLFHANKTKLNVEQTHLQSVFTVQLF